MDASNISINASTNELYLDVAKVSPDVTCSYGPNSPKPDRTVEHTSSMIRSQHDDFPFNFCNPPPPQDSPPNSPPEWSPEEAGFLFGMFEMRAKLPSKADKFPAFWLGGNNGWPPEIDAFEYNSNNPNEFFSTHWWNQTPDLRCTNWFNFPFNLSDDYHTWTIVWTPNEISWFFDGKELKTSNHNVLANIAVGEPPSNICLFSKMDIIINNSFVCPNQNSYVDDPLIVDYIKVYKPTNLPEYNGGDNKSSFDAYYNNELVPCYNNITYKRTGDWVLNRIETKSSTENYEVISDLNVVQNGGMYIYRGLYDLIWQTYYDVTSEEFKSWPLSWSQNVTGDISTSQNGSIVFYKHDDKPKYYQNGSFREVSSWKICQSALVADESGKNVYYIDVAGYIRHFFRNSISSLSWSNNRLYHHGNISGKIIIDPNDSSIIYYQRWKQLWTTQRIGSGWSNPRKITPVQDVGDDWTISPDSNTILYENHGDILHKLTRTASGTWSRGVVTAKFAWTNGQALVRNIKNSIQIGQNNNIYYQADDDRIWTIYSSNNINFGTSIDVNLDYVNFGLGLTNTWGGSLAFVGYDKKIRRINWQNPCEWLNPECETHKYYFNEDDDEIESRESHSAEKKESLLFPNPVGDILNVVLTEPQLNNNMVLSDAMGRQITNYEYSDTENLEINVSSLTPGLYYLSISNDTKTELLKFVKN